MEEKIISELEDADNMLSDDNYKSWCYVRLAIGEAIKLIKSYEKRTICHCDKPVFKESVSGLILCQNCGRP